MGAPSDAWLGWARTALAGPTSDISGPVEVVRGLREGGAPWLLRAAVGEETREFVLATGDRESLRTEIAGLSYAATHGVLVPAVVAAALEHEPPLLLIEAIAGTSTIPIERPTSRLRTLGAAAAALHAIDAPTDPALPSRARPIPGVDFAALRRSQPRRALLERAERALAARQGRGIDGFVHGDLWQGNVLWEGDDLVAIIDWDCAGYGPAGVDLGSLRCDAAVCFGVEAAADILDGWQAQAGRDADDISYWDVVAALSTPPDMGWFREAIADQGRTDLTQETLLERRDAFVTSALDQLG